MRLLILAEDFYPNISGGAHARWRFCQLAAQRGHDVTVFTPKRDGTPRNETVDGVHIKRPFPAKPSNVPAYATLALITRTIYSVLLFGFLVWWLRGRSFDGIHSASHSMHWVGKTLSTLYGMPLVTFIGYTPSANGTFQWRPSFLRERVNFRLFMGQRVFCRSQEVASILRDTTGGRVDTIHGILNTERVQEAADRSETEHKLSRQRFGFSDGERVLIFVGRLVPIKNPLAAIKTLASLSSNYVLLVVGDGPMSTAVREHAERAGVADRVRFAGKLPHDHTLECIAWSECLLLSSHEEAYPTAVFEALALGTDVIATPVGVLPDIEHERLHLGAIEEFPTLIKSRNIVSTSGIDEDVLDQYSMERYTEEILTTFEELTTD